MFVECSVMAVAGGVLSDPDFMRSPFGQLSVGRSLAADLGRDLPSGPHPNHPIHGTIIWSCKRRNSKPSGRQLRRQTCFIDSVFGHSLLVGRVSIEGEP